MKPETSKAKTWIAAVLVMVALFTVVRNALRQPAQ